MNSNLKISIVIPSIGDRDLYETFHSINTSTIKIDEIILSLPANSNFNIDKYKKFKNLKIHYSKTKGQVAQRIEGFKVAQNDIIVQLDDDIILEKNCLKLMFDFIKLKKSTAVSAHFFNVISKKSIYIKDNNFRISNFLFLAELNYFKNQFINNIYNKIKNGNISQNNGSISRSGFETYPYFQDHKKPFISGWIPGGCVMHHQENLILSNFFPFSGKAYCEDLYHSIALKNNNISLYYHPNAKAFLKIESKKSNFKLFIKYLKDDFIIRKKLVEDNKLSKSRMFLVYLIKLFAYFIK